MPVGTKATVKAVDPDELARARRRDPARQHLPPALPARRRPDRRARRPAPLHGLGRPDPDRLRRLPGLLAPRTRSSRRTTTGVTFRSVYDGDAARFTPELAARDPGAARLRHRDVPRRRARRRTRRGASSSEAVRLTTLWAQRQREAERAPGQLLFGIAQGGSDPELRRRSSRRSPSSASTATRSAASRSASRGADARDDRLGRGAAPGRAPALLHGHRRPGRHPRGDRARDRHVRLRAADPQRAAPARRSPGRAGST